MNRMHVVVHRIAIGECLQTDPADVCTTTSARHVVASRVPFDKRLAAGAPLDVARARPFFEQPKLLCFVVWAPSTFVSLDVTVRADTDEARRTLQDGTRKSTAVDLRTVGSWAVMELVRTGMDICKERGARKTLEVLGRQ